MMMMQAFLKIIKMSRRIKVVTIILRVTFMLTLLTVT